jgi:hypothetical protein
MNHQKRAEPLRIMLLRSLAADGSQTSMELTKRLNPYPGMTLTQSRNGVNGRLNNLGSQGYAQIAGKIPTAYHNTPAFLWTVTPAGRRHLADFDTARAAQAQDVRDRQARKDRRGAALRWLIRTAVDSNWGPATPTADRRAISRWLREKGMPYDWIAAVFDVSHECVRLDCNGMARRQGAQIQTDPLVIPAQGPGYVWPRTLFRAPDGEAVDG